MTNTINNLNAPKRNRDFCFIKCVKYLKLFFLNGLFGITIYT